MFYPNYIHCKLFVEKSSVVIVATAALESSILTALMCTYSIQFLSVTSDSLVNFTGYQFSCNQYIWLFHIGPALGGLGPNAVLCKICCVYLNRQGYISPALDPIGLKPVLIPETCLKVALYLPNFIWIWHHEWHGIF